MTDLTRRGFLGLSSAAALGVALAAGCRSGKPVPKTYAIKTKRGRATENEKITLGFIGVAGRGSHLMQWFMRHPDVNVGAVCDVYQPHLDAAMARTGGTAKAYRDFRDLLEQRDIDAVVIATPPHWHALMTIYACQTGRDVYVEKPMCLCPGEGRAMVKAAREYNRVTQVGTQIHAEENYARVVEVVRSGVLGPISAVQTQLLLNEAPDGIGNPPDSDPPEGLDWDLWCGPLDPMPFNIARFQAGQHRYFADLGGGSWLTEMGPHIIDLPCWALNLPAPKAVSASGGRYVMKDISTIPDTMEAVFEYDNMVMSWTNYCANSHGFSLKEEETDMIRRLGASFHGVNGTLTADYAQFRINGEGERMKDVPLPEKTLPRSPGHDREFLDAVKSRTMCSCDVEHHYPLHVALNLGNLSLKLGRKLVWDAERERVVGDKEANGLIQPRYRRPWVLPA